MRRWLLVMVVVGALGGVVAAMPALTAAASSTPPMTGSFTASDYAFMAAGGGSTVSIATGGTVSFSYPTGGSEHNVDFGHGAQPTTCTVGSQTQAPPIPSTPTAPGWSGTCTFDTPGTYTFHCDLHNGMTGTIIVGQEAGTTTTTGAGTTTTGSGSGTTTTGTMTMPMTMPMGTQTTSTTTQKTLPSPIAGSTHTAIKVAGAKGGHQVTGTIKVSSAGKGGHAVISVLASTSALKGGHSKQPVALGHLRLDGLRAGAVGFKLDLKTVARRALTAHRRLQITVQISVAAVGAQTVSTARSLVLRA